MKRVISLLSAVFGVLLLLPSFSYAADSVPEEALAARESVYRVLSEDDEYEYSGSSFVVGSDTRGTYFVTNYHVVEGTNLQNISVVQHDGTELPAAVLGYDEEYDLCILQTSSPVQSAVPLTLSTQGAALAGDAVYALGFPGAGDYLLDDYAYAVEDITVTDGIISAVKSVTIKTKMTTLLQMNAAINPGSSGGPLVNGKGEVVGVNALSILEAQDVYAAVSVSHLTGLLQQYNVSFETPGESVASEPTAAAPVAPWLWAVISAAVLAITAALFWILRARRLTLSTLLSRRLQGYTPEEALHKLRPVFYALAPLHARGEAHGSIYPANLYVDRAGDLHLGNRHRKSVLNEKTRPYLPMEQYEQQAKPGTYSDVYALGAVLLHMITCTLPPDVMIRLQGDTLEQFRPISGLSDQAWQALLGALAIRKEDRLHDIEQFSQAIHSEFQIQQTGQSVNVEVAANTAELSALELPLDTQTEQKKRWHLALFRQGYFAADKKAKEKRILLICSGGLLLILAALLIFNESSYKRAVACCENNDFTAAANATKSTFLIYKDTRTLCEYVSAGLYLQAGYYQQAKEQFNALGDYRDASEMALECDYQHAVSMLNSGQLESAKFLFTAIKSYSDSETMAMECDYRKAIGLLRENKYTEATILFTKLSKSSYRNSETMKQEAEYRHATAILERFVAADSEAKKDQPIQLALVIFKSLDKYSDSAQMLEEVKNEIYLEGQRVFEENVLNGFNDLYHLYLYFSMIEEYLDSSEYLGIYRAIVSTDSLSSQYNVLMGWWNTELGRQVILSNTYILYFLEGTWKGDGCYLKIREEDDGSMPCSYDFPWKMKSGYYKIENLEFYQEYDNEWDKQFLMVAIDKDLMMIFSYKNGKTYMLSRQ